MPRKNQIRNPFTAKRPIILWKHASLSMVFPKVNEPQNLPLTWLHLLLMTAPSLSDEQIQASVDLPLPLQLQHILPTCSAAMVLTLHLNLQVPLLAQRTFDSGYTNHISSSLCFFSFKNKFNLYMFLFQMVNILWLIFLVMRFYPLISLFMMFFVFLTYSILIC